MARLKGSDGRITIDDEAAYADKYDIQAAKYEIEVALVNASQAQQQLSELGGQAAQAAREKIAELLSLLRRAREDVMQVDLAITRIVTHYQEIDRKLRAQVQGGGDGGW